MKPWSRRTPDGARARLKNEKGHQGPHIGTLLISHHVFQSQCCVNVKSDASSNIQGYHKNLIQTFQLRTSSVALPQPHFKTLGAWQMRPTLECRRAWSAGRKRFVVAERRPGWRGHRLDVKVAAAAALLRLRDLDLWRSKLVAFRLIVEPGSGQHGEGSRHVLCSVSVQRLFQ